MLLKNSCLCITYVSPGFMADYIKIFYAKILPRCSGEKEIEREREEDGCVTLFSPRINLPCIFESTTESVRSILFIFS